MIWAKIQLFAESFKAEQRTQDLLLKSVEIEEII